MFKALRQVYPCGINGSLYSDVETFKGIEIDELLRSKLVKYIV